MDVPTWGRHGGVNVRMSIHPHQTHVRLGQGMPMHSADWEAVITSEREQSLTPLGHTADDIWNLNIEMRRLKLLKTPRVTALYSPSYKTLRWTSGIWYSMREGHQRIPGNAGRHSHGLCTLDGEQHEVTEVITVKHRERFFYDLPIVSSFFNMPKSRSLWGACATPSLG